MTTLTLFVTEIRKTSTEVLVTAVNGSISGPPILSWYVSSEEAKEITLGEQYQVTITECFKD